jgi:exosortase/archaeosortase family protein
MNIQNKKISNIFIRYLIIILAGLGNLYIFYKILTPLTVAVLETVLSLYTEVLVSTNLLYISSGKMIEIAPACVAGAAFFLLLILVFSTAEITPRRRFIVLVTSFTILFVLNITRILVLVSLIGSTNFEQIHWVFWHIVSIVFVVATWIAMTYLYKIKTVPVYSDIKYLIRLIKPRKKSKRSKKN